MLCTVNNRDVLPFCRKTIPSGFLSHRSTERRVRKILYSQHSLLGGSERRSLVCAHQRSNPRTRTTVQLTMLAPKYPHAQDGRTRLRVRPPMCSSLEFSDISLNFPRSDLCPVEVPFAVFLAQVILVQRLTKRFLDELTVFHLFQCFG